MYSKKIEEEVKKLEERIMREKLPIKFPNKEVEKEEKERIFKDAKEYLEKQFPSYKLHPSRATHKLYRSDTTYSKFIMIIDKETEEIFMWAVTPNKI